MVNMQSFVRKSWTYSRSLTAVFVLMILTLALNLLGLVIDDRVITGVPAWLKPTKFAVSVAIFTATLLWTLQFVTRSLVQARRASRIISICLVIEIAIIDLQAARGTISHFNRETTLDAVLFGIMAAAILVLWLATVWLCVLFFRQPFAVSAFGWAVRLGMLITVVGAIAGGLMVRPTKAQQAAFATGVPKAVGGHTVGGPDGGPGLPVTNWSSNHGDLRIPHFLGLHGLQAIPLLYVFFIRRRPQASQTKLVITGAASYTGLTILLGWQALRGQSIVDPDGATIIVGAIWLALSISGILLSLGRPEQSHAAATQLL
jgi:hypothetical protein